MALALGMACGLKAGENLVCLGTLKSSGGAGPHDGEQCQIPEALGQRADWPWWLKWGSGGGKGSERYPDEGHVAPAFWFRGRGWGLRFLCPLHQN